MENYYLHDLWFNHLENLENVLNYSEAGKISASCYMSYVVMYAI